MIKWKKETKGEEGMTLDYGIALRNGKITCEKITHLPIFLLSLDQRHLNQGLREFKNDNDPSEYEKNSSDIF